jgi:glycosyltransferase involved in cell wall biosynthesis
MPAKILIASTVQKVAGAERIISLIKNSAEREFGVDVATLDSPRGVFRILFGSYRIIHSHLFWTGVMVGVRRIWDKSFFWIHTLHYADYSGQKCAFLRHFLDRRFVFLRADVLTAVSQASRALLGTTSSRLIENAITLSRRLRPRSPHKEIFTIGCLAMLRREKGIDQLLIAFKEARIKNKSLRLKIGGCGPELGRLKRLAQELGIDEYTEFAGWVRPEDFYSSIDAYVQPSRSESFGLAVLEAFQFEMPIAVTNVGNLPNVVGHGTYGLLLESNSSELAQGLLDLEAKKAELIRASQLGFNYWSQRLNVEEMIRQYLDLYSEIIRSVCVIAPIVTHAVGGIQRQIFLQTKELTDLGWKINIIQREDPHVSQQKDKWCHASIWEIHEPWWVKINTRLRGLFFVLQGFLLLFKKRRFYQVIHAHQLFSPTMAGGLAKIVTGKRLIVKVTASGELGEVSELRQLPLLTLRKAIFRKIDHVIAINPEMKRELAEFGFNEKKVKLIPNGVLISDSLPPRSFDDRVRILFAGRLSREKRLDLLLRAAKDLSLESWNLEITVLGSEFKDRSISKDLEPWRRIDLPRFKVNWLGHVDNVSDYMMNHSIFVLPSSTEGLSNALLEAMSHGMICVCSDIPANKFVVDHLRNGFLFESGSSRSLKLVLRQIVQWEQSKRNVLDKIRDEARRTVKLKFSKTKIAEQIGQLYQEGVHGAAVTRIQ